MGLKHTVQGPSLLNSNSINLPIVEKYHALTLLRPPLPPDNDTEVTREQPQGGEWQNISWLPFPLNTSIKAYSGWVSGVAPLHDSDLPGFMHWEKLNVYLSSDKLNSGRDTLAVIKILAVRCSTLLELISTANSPTPFLFIRLMDVMPFDHWEPVKKPVWGVAPWHVLDNSMKTQLSVRNAFIGAAFRHAAWNS